MSAEEEIRQDEKDISKESRSFDKEVMQIGSEIKAEKSQLQVQSRGYKKNRPNLFRIGLSVAGARTTAKTTTMNDLRLRLIV